MAAGETASARAPSIQERDGCSSSAPEPTPDLERFTEPVGILPNMGTSDVGGYKKQDGTVVRPHTRSSQQGAAPDESASPNAAKAAAAAQGLGASNDGDKGYLGVHGGLPPDRESIAFWKASKWASKHDMADPVGPVRMEDGRHAVAIYELDSSEDPRGDTADLFTGLGTFAVMGDSGPSRKRFIPLGDEKFGGERTDWWKHRRSDDIQEGLPWMIREMRGEPNDEDDDWSEETPTWDEMNEAALAYRERTGDYAFPLYLHNRGQDFQMGIGQPAEGAADPYLPGEPSGFAFLSRKQAESMDNEPTIEQAYGWMKYAADVRNDWAAGSPTEGLVAYFDDDTGTDGPDDLIGTNSCKNDELDEAMRDTMSSFY